MHQILDNYPVEKRTAILCRSIYAALESIEVRKVTYTVRVVTGIIT